MFFVTNSASNNNDDFLRSFNQTPDHNVTCMVRGGHRAVVPRVGIIPSVDGLVVRVTPAPPRWVPAPSSSASPAATAAGTSGRPAWPASAVSVEIGTAAALFQVAFVLLFLSTAPTPTVVVSTVQTRRAVLVARFVLVIAISGSDAAAGLDLAPLFAAGVLLCLVLFACRRLSALFLFDPSFPFALKAKNVT